MGRENLTLDVAGVLLIGSILPAVAWPVVGPDLRIVGETVGCLALPLCIPAPFLWVLPVALALGAVSCFKRTRFWVALVGAVVAVLLVGALAMSSALGLIALVLILASREEFEVLLPGRGARTEETEPSVAEGSP